MQIAGDPSPSRVPSSVHVPLKMVALDMFTHLTCRPAILQAKDVADAARSQAELHASQLQQQLDLLLSEQQAGQEELQQAQGQAAEAQSRCLELETQLASVQAQAQAHQEAAARATEEQQAAQRARAGLETQLQQLEAQLKAFQDLPAQMTDAEAAHAQVTDFLCLSLLWGRVLPMCVAKTR